jgi:PPOX class probable F420-dependent enzyme
MFTWRGTILQRMTTTGDLAATSYVSLTSYKRDGTPVSTPVWVVADDGALAVWSARDTFKVKRIGRNPAVTLAPCTFRGEALGEAVPGRAEILDPAGSARIRAAIKRKYGFLGWLTTTASRIRRGTDGSVGIRIELT